jgi:hypothetical protein
MPHRKTILTALALALIASFVSVTFWGAAKATRESGQRSLLMQAERKLAAYHAEHGAYPDSLAGFRFQFHEGANATTLARLEYRTDGKYYRIVTKSDWDGSELSVCH